MKSNRIILSLAAALFPALITTASADTLAKWTFETSAPATAGTFSPEIGSGSASGFHASGSAVYSSPAGNGSAHSFSANTWAVGDSWLFQVDTTGFQNLSVSYDQTSSSTGPSKYSFEYSTDGSSFTTFSANYTPLVNGSPNSPWTSSTFNSAYTFNFDLSTITALNNDSSIFFRVIDTSTVAENGSAVAATGTDRLDNFTVSATVVPEPSTITLAGMAGLSLIHVYRRKKKA